MTQLQKRVSKEGVGYGKTVIFSVSLPEEIVDEVEKRRRYDSRSRYILRAVDHYLNRHNDKEKYCTAEEEHDNSGVRGAYHLQGLPPTTNTSNFVNQPATTAGGPTYGS